MSATAPKDLPPLVIQRHGTKLAVDRPWPNAKGPGPFRLLWRAHGLRIDRDILLTHLEARALIRHIDSLFRWARTPGRRGLEESVKALAESPLDTRLVRRLAHEILDKCDELDDEETGGKK